MKLDDLARVRIEVATGPLQWINGLTVSLPRKWLEETGLWPEINASRQLSLSNDILPPPESMAEELRSLATWIEHKPVSARLPFSYQAIPSRLRSVLASILGKFQRYRSNIWAKYPQWPLDLSADFVSDWASKPASVSPGYKTPVMLSHDLDSLEGLRNVVQDFLPLEEQYGARSSNYVVPHGWKLDHGLLSEIANRGHEIGIHGHDHANKTPFLEPKAMRERLEESLPIIERYNIKGYRAPSLVRTENLLRELERLYVYDSSIPTSGGLFPTPNNGCASARVYHIGKLIELPLSLPRDGSLRFLGYRPHEIVKLWIDCCEKIALSGGTVVLLTHCEQRFSGNAPMLQAYRDFLKYIASNSRYQWTLPLNHFQKLGFA